MTWRSVRRTLGPVAVAVLVVEGVLVLGGVLDLGAAVRIVLLVEACLLAFVVAEVVVVVRTTRARQRAGEDLPHALQSGLEDFLPPVVAGLVRHDVMQVRAIWLVVNRRRDLRPDERALPCHGSLPLLLGAVCAGDAVAAGLLHVLLPAAWRPVALVLAVLGLVWLVGFGASLVAYPHAVSSDRVRLRFAAFKDVSVPMSALVRAGRARGEPASQKSAEIVDDELVMAVTGQANLRIDLRETRTSSVSTGLDGRVVNGVTCFVNQPGDAIALVHEAADPPPGQGVADGAQ